MKKTLIFLVMVSIIASMTVGSAFSMTQFNNPQRQSTDYTFYEQYFDKVVDEYTAFQGYPPESIYQNKPTYMLPWDYSSYNSTNSIKNYTNASYSTYTAKSDLTISKIVKKSTNTYEITVKNIGERGSAQNYLGIYVGTKLIKTAQVYYLNAGQSHKITITLNSKYSKSTKNFKVDYKNVVKESNEKNNAKSAK